MRNRYSRIWFLLGLGSQFQIIASLSMTELFLLVAAPILFFREYPLMKRNGVSTFFNLSLLVIVGCGIACVANHTAPQAALRGFATTCLISCAVIVCHWFLRKDLGGFKWFLIGASISFFLSTFIFQHSVEVMMLAEGQSGAQAVDAIMGGPIYWIGRLSSFVTAILRGWYLQCPIIFSILFPIALALFSVLSSESGRSIALGLLGTSVLVLIGGKSPQRIWKNLCKRLWFWIFIAFLGLFAINQVYRYSAMNGLMGERAREKYEAQTHGSSSILKLLMGGRMAAFCGLFACVDKPVVGWGPWAMDTEGYTEEFLAKYGEAQDYQDYISTKRFNESQRGFSTGLIPAHSHIVGFWLWFGVFGLIFWLYVLFVLFRFLRQDCFAVPQCYMWLVGGIPAYLWGIFFSPFSDRVTATLFVVACLMVRAVRQGRLALPPYMLREIQTLEEQRK